MRDLFGNDRPDPGPASAPVLTLNLFDAAAERAALASGRPKSQERAVLVAPPGYSCVCGDPLTKRGLLSRCAGCGR